jgi:hypothetical protein
MYGPYYRVGDSPDVVRKIVETGELWGKSPRNIFQSNIPKVKAYRGELPPGISGIQFETEIPPDRGSVPDKPTWSAIPTRHGIRVDGDFAKIKVHVVKETVL